MFGLEINLFAVATATLMSMALGIIWYSPMVCGTWWMEIVGVREEDIASGVIERGWRFLAGFVLHFIVLASVAYLLRVLGEVTGVSFVRIMVTLSMLIVAGYVSMVIWENKSIRYLGIAGGYALLFLWVGAAIIEYWPW